MSQEGDMIDQLQAEIDDLKAKLEASLQVQFDAAAFEKVKRERDAAERAGAQMREALKDALSVFDAADKAPGEVLCTGDRREAWERALSCGCGQGFVRVSELDKPINLLSNAMYSGDIREALKSLQTLRGGTA